MKSPERWTNRALSTFTQSADRLPQSMALRQFFSLPPCVPDDCRGFGPLMCALRISALSTAVGQQHHRNQNQRYRRNRTAQQAPYARPAAFPPVQCLR